MHSLSYLDPNKREEVYSRMTIPQGPSEGGIEADGERSRTYTSVIDPSSHDHDSVEFRMLEPSSGQIVRRTWMSLLPSGDRHMTHLNPPSPLW